MKNIFKATLAVAAVAAIGMGSVKTYNNYTANNETDNLLFTENVLALSDGGASASGISCFCTTRGPLANNVCTANASGMNCGTGECWKLDGNCRG